jgi:GNAT superfamily N-acetyltransferase
MNSLIGLRIREARAVDVDILDALAYRAKASHGYDEAFMTACREEMAIKVSTLSERDVWVAECDGNGIVGFFGLWPSDDGVAEVDPLYVEPRVHGLGVGRALWARLEQQAKAAGATRIGVDSDPHAVRFYLNMGCVPAGQSPSGSIPGRMLPRLEKIIA